MRQTICVLGLLLSVVWLPIAQSQEDEVAPPDVVGMGVPQAAAALNAAGFQVGRVEGVEWTEQSAQDVNTVSAQHSDPDTLRLVHLEVLREYNVRLRYDLAERLIPDEHWFVLYNLSSEPLYVADLRFVATSDESVALDRHDWGWTVDEILEDRCLQILPSVVDSNSSRNFIRPNDCPELRQAYSETNPQRQFWISDDGQGQFHVLQEGLHRATCDIAAEECLLWISPQDATLDVTEYSYFVYDAQALYVVNRSEDKWMRLGAITVQDDLPFADFFQEPSIASLDFLAPGQCARLDAGGSIPQSPASCDVVASASLGGEAVFWREGFAVQNARNADNPFACPAAAEDGQTACLVPQVD